MQWALIQYRNPKNYDLVREALRKAGREDLIGYDRRCLVRPERSGGKAMDGGARGAAGAVRNAGAKGGALKGSGSSGAAAAKKPWAALSRERKPCYGCRKDSRFFWQPEEGVCTSEEKDHTEYP